MNEKKNKHLTTKEPTASEEVARKLSQILAREICTRFYSLAEMRLYNRKEGLQTEDMEPTVPVSSFLFTYCKMAYRYVSRN